MRVIKLIMQVVLVSVLQVAAISAFAQGAKVSICAQNGTSTLMVLCTEDNCAGTCVCAGLGEVTSAQSVPLSSSFSVCLLAGTSCTSEKVLSTSVKQTAPASGKSQLYSVTQDTSYNLNVAPTTGGCR